MLKAMFTCLRRLNVRTMMNNMLTCLNFVYSWQALGSMVGSQDLLCEDMSVVSLPTLAECYTGCMYMTWLW